MMRKEGVGRHLSPYVIACDIDMLNVVVHASLVKCLIVLNNYPV